MRVTVSGAASNSSRSMPPVPRRGMRGNACASLGRWMSRPWQGPSATDRGWAGAELGKFFPWSMGSLWNNMETKALQAGHCDCLTGF